MEIYNDWLSSKMTRSELNELTVEDMKERRRLQKVKYNKKFREKNPENDKKYYEEHKEEIKEYRQTPNGKKSTILSQWKLRGLHETTQELDRIYDLFLNQELCNACDVKLTRNGDRCSTDVTMDHDHDTNRFRHIICRSCNCQDNWKKYFC